MADDATPPAPPPDEPRPARRTYELPNVLGVPVEPPPAEPDTRAADTLALLVRLTVGVLLTIGVAAVLLTSQGVLPAILFTTVAVLLMATHALHR